MKDNFDFLQKIIGKKIQGIDYLENTYECDLSGDWTNTDPNSLLLTMQELELKLKSSTNIFFSNSNSLTISEKSSFSEHQKTSVPKAFDWPKVIGATIVNYRLWRFERSYSKKHFLSRSKITPIENAMIQLALNNSYQLFFTIVEGDLGRSLFYPSGILNDMIGIFMNKLIASRVDFEEFSFKLNSV